MFEPSDDCEEEGEGIGHVGKKVAEVPAGAVAESAQSLSTLGALHPFDSPAKSVLSPNGNRRPKSTRHNDWEVL